MIPPPITAGLSLLFVSSTISLWTKTLRHAVICHYSFSYYTLRVDSLKSEPSKTPFFGLLFNQLVSSQVKTCSKATMSGVLKVVYTAIMELYATAQGFADSLLAKC